MSLMRTFTAAAVVALALLAGGATAAHAAPARPHTFTVSVTVPSMSNGQLIRAYDCHPVNVRPTGLVRGTLRDNLATARRDLRYFRSHGAGVWGKWKVTHNCYR